MHSHRRMLRVSIILTSFYPFLCPWFTTLLCNTECASAAIWHLTDAVCVFVSYFEQQHQCRTCQCRRVNKPRDFRVFAFLRQRFVPAPVEGGAETCCALGFLVHIASNSANSKQDMKDEVWMRQDKRWEATGLMRVAKASGPSCQRGWGASVLYRCWTPLCGC